VFLIFTQEEYMFKSLNKSKQLKSVGKVVVSMLAAVVFSVSAHADTEFTAKVKAAMADMKSEAGKLGAPKIDGDALYLGKTKINGNFELVDALKTKFGGTATIFVKKGNGFVRISTNVLKEGNRAVGTQLDPSGPAIAAIRQGNAYYGIVDILGKLYDTGYEPIKNAKGEIVGIYYVGQLME
jgi:hypothetical protein